MSLQLFYQWNQEIRNRFKGLKKWQAMGLALISFGIIRSRRSQASLIAEELPEFGKASTVERRIQRWLANRRINLQEACLSWVRWVMENYTGDQIYLLVDETKISDRIGCMMISLAVQKRAIPLGWKCYQANSAAAYPAEGQVKLILNLLKQVLKSLPENKTVILEADRGIGHSSNLMREVEKLGIKFLFRVNASAIFTTQAGKSANLMEYAQQGQSRHYIGTLFTKHRWVRCNLHLVWHPNQEEPWCLATNLSGLTGEEYAFRVWQEESFRDLKSGGWQWQGSLIRNPEVVDRLVLPMALAYAWCVSIGLIFLSNERLRKPVDCIRTHIKYSVFRMGLRVIKRYLYLDPSKIPLGIGPFPSPT